jgi:alpha-beta hydrolase superfamily lysophospholipase
MGSDGRVDLDAVRGPLLLIAGEKDEIVPAHLTEKNAKAYKHPGSVTAFKAFEGRSHYICGEPGWEEVAEYTAGWLEQQGFAETITTAREHLAVSTRH